MNKKAYHYVGTSKIKITLPFIPIKIEEWKMSIEDKYALINRIFGDTLPSDEPYPKIYDLLIDAITFNDASFWREAGEMMLGLKNEKHQEGGRHCLKVADMIEHKPFGRKKKFFPNYTSEDSVKRFRRLLKGEI